MALFFHQSRLILSMALILFSLHYTSAQRLSSSETDFSKPLPATTQQIAFRSFREGDKNNEFAADKFQQLITSQPKPINKFRVIGKTLAYTGGALLLSSLLVAQANKDIGRGVFFSGVAIAPVALIFSIKGRRK